MTAPPAGARRFYKALALGFRGTEGEWHHLRKAMNIFAFAIIPVMFSVHTIVSWDFAMAMRPGWHSTIFGPYFVVGALHSGVSRGGDDAVMSCARTMKHMKYFIRPEHFDALGKLMLIFSMAWAYFFFNDYLVQWYGGDEVVRQLLHFHATGPMAWMWYAMLICNIVIPWLTLWNKKIRRTPWLLFIITLLINVGMYFERYIIIPLTLGHQRMPFDWGEYTPRLPEISHRVRHAVPVHPALPAGLALDPAGPGLGSAGRPGSAHAAQGRQDGCAFGLGAGLGRRGCYGQTHHTSCTVQRRPGRRNL